MSNDTPQSLTSTLLTRHQQRYRDAKEAVAEWLSAECGLTLRDARLEASVCLEDARRAARQAQPPVPAMGVGGA